MKVVKLYKKLFSVPRNEVLILFTIATIASSLFLNLTFFWITAFVFTFLAINFAKTRFNLRRTLFFANILTVFAAVLSVFSIPQAVTLLIVSTMHFCSERKKIAQIFSTFPLLAFPSYKTLIIFLFSLILFFIFLKILDRSYGKINVKEFVENFVLYWLTSEAKFLEKTFEKWSEIKNGRVRCLCINDVKVLTTDFHPGPFRNVGGANLIKFLSTGRAVYLHSPTSHEMDPVSSEEILKIVNNLPLCKEKLKPMKPFKLESKNFEIFCIPFDKIKFIFVSGKNFIDDFKLFSKDVVIDCHNSHVYNFKLEIEDLEEIEKIVKIAEITESEKVDKVKFAFVKIDAESESICNYVAALLFDFGEKYAIVIFDANNMVKDFRDLVEEEFKRIGYRAVVVTTDNHEKTGLRTKSSYKPAGSDRKDLEILKILLNECRDVEMVDAEFKFDETLVEVKVFGNAIDDSERAVERSGKLIAIFLAFNLLITLLSATLEVIA